MKSLPSSEIREIFLRFFEERGHTRFPSSSLVPNDPTMLLTTAGMVQFKPFFLGLAEPANRRATSCQKCLRTTDIHEVGRTARHLTFFEMLGNFSFGDYYKAEIIPWSWELLTEGYGLPAEKMHATIYKDDDDAARIWREKVGIPEERIHRLGEESNFWSAGPTGPCGPCSEILFDLGEERSCGKPTCGIECDCDRYLEIWNLVFMQYNRDEEGRLTPLERTGIDTGMGLERLAAVLQGAETNFETDQLQGIIDKMCELSGARYHSSPETDVSLRVIADHARAVTFLIGDGVLPSNEGRGYVLRRLLRRTVRHGRLLNVRKPFLNRLIDVVVQTMGDAYPELKEHHSYIQRIASTEEKRFAETLRQGTAILSEAIDRVRALGGITLPGDVAFRLHDTYGFPLELTTEVAEEQNLTVDEAGFHSLMEEQKARASAAQTFYQATEANVMVAHPPTEFLGYETMETEAAIRDLIVEGESFQKATEGAHVEVILDRTTFYAEAGGQVGDGGRITTETGEIDIDTTYAQENGVYLHRGRVSSGTVLIGQTAQAKVEPGRRQATQRNHTATHLLHWALRKHLGDHVRQAGSLVEARRLRFDFTHFSPLSREDLRELERMVNERILANYPVRTTVMPLDSAKELGAIGLFGEKYGDVVRVVEAGDFSKELCGGTHVQRTGDIGLVRIVSEGSVGANLRRLEALSGTEAVAYTQERERVLDDLGALLGAKAEELPARMAAVLETQKRLADRVENLERKTRRSKVDELLAHSEQVDSLWSLVAEVDAQDFDELRSYLDLIREKFPAGIVLLGARTSDKALLVASVSRDLFPQGLDAGRLIKEAASKVGGGGGGRPDLAQAGGRNPGNLPQALDSARALIRSFAAGALQPEPATGKKGRQ